MQDIFRYVGETLEIQDLDYEGHVITFHVKMLFSFALSMEIIVEEPEGKMMLLVFLVCVDQARTSWEFT